MVGIYLRALYEYTRQGDEELTFPEGAIIELVNKSVSGIDDGWWEGSYGGKTGLFPSVVVELIQDQCTTAVSVCVCARYLTVKVNHVKHNCK